MCKVLAFHGADRKVGTTMITQCIAEMLADRKKDAKVLLMMLNARVNNQFLDKDLKCIDDFKLQLESKLLDGKDFERNCRYKGNLYVLAGLKNEFDVRNYFPENIKYLIGCIKSEFDFIVIDTGETLDNGIALGAVQEADEKYLVITQEEAVVERYINLLKLYRKMDIIFERIIINKYDNKDIYTKGYISERINIGKERLVVLYETTKGRLAEREKKSFCELKEEKWTKSIKEIADNILEVCNSGAEGEKRKNKRWKSFI